MKRFLQTTMALTRAIAFDFKQRRRVMMGMVLLDAVLLFLGVTLLAPSIDSHPAYFAGYWLACCVLTLAIMLLALYDLLAVISAGRLARRTLEAQLREAGKSSTKAPPSNTSAQP